MGGDLCGLILREVVGLTLLGIVGAHDGCQVGFWSGGLTGCHVALVLLILKLLASDYLLKTQILSAFTSKVLHLLQLLHKLSGIGILILGLFALDSCSHNVWVLLEELLDEVLLSILVAWSIFIRIVSIVFLSRCLGIRGVIYGSVLGRNRRSILYQ